MPTVQTNLIHDCSDSDNKFQIQQPIECQGLPTGSWPHIHLFADRREWSTTHFRGDALSTPRFSTYRWLSTPELVVNQISHGTVLVPSRYIGRKFSLTADQISVASHSTSLKLYALNRMTTDRELLTILYLLNLRTITNWLRPGTWNQCGGADNFTPDY